MSAFNAVKKVIFYRFHVVWEVEGEHKHMKEGEHKHAKVDSLLGCHFKARDADVIRQTHTQE